MKNYFKPLAIVLFAGTLILNLSFDSQGNLSAPMTTTEPGKWAEANVTCPDSTVITGCTGGTDKDCNPDPPCSTKP